MAESTVSCGAGDSSDGVSVTVRPPCEPPASCVFYVDKKTNGLSAEALQHYDRHGFIVLRQVMTAGQADDVRKEMHRIIDDWYDKFEDTGEELADWLSMVNREDRARRGELTVDTHEKRYLSVRRLFRMAVHDDYFRKASCEDSTINKVIEQVLGEDVKLLQSMALLKPPGAAEKRWHQDNGYFRLTPNHLMAFWIAIDEATIENGCMHVVPGTHKQGVDEHHSPNGFHTLYSLLKTPDEKQIIPIPLKPGDALVFHGELHHYTPPNKSNGPRYAFQLHFASGKCRPTKCPKTAANQQEDDASEERKTTAVVDQVPAGAVTTSSDGGTGDGDRGFDCDPSVKCVEPQFWYFRKAERLVLGQDYGDPHI